MRYVAIEPAPEGELVREIDHGEAWDLLVDNGVHIVNAKGLMDYLPCGVKISVKDLTIQRLA